MAAAAGALTDFSELDNAGISKEHWKIMFISGMGFFTIDRIDRRGFRCDGWRGLPAAVERGIGA